MAISYKITNVELVGSVVKITYQYTLFDTAIVDKVFLPVDFTDVQMKQFISNKINATRIIPTDPLSPPDTNLGTLVALKGNTYITTVHP